jgi:hypothetical protein
VTRLKKASVYGAVLLASTLLRIQPTTKEFGMKVKTRVKAAGEGGILIGIIYIGK